MLDLLLQRLLDGDRGVGFELSLADLLVYSTTDFLGIQMTCMDMLLTCATTVSRGKGAARHKMGRVRMIAMLKSFVILID